MWVEHFRGGKRERCEELERREGGLEVDIG